MKQLLPVLLSSFVSTSALMVLLAFVWPQFFFLVPGLGPSAIQPSPGEAAQESVQVDPPKTNESGTVTPASTGDSATHPPRTKDSVRTIHAAQPVPDVTKAAHQSPEDSIKALIKALQDLRERFNKPGFAFSDSLTDSEVKTMAQIFEAMDPENAARIISNMDDHAMRKVLTTMKKRQSAKILGALSPQHAARILNGKGEL